MAIPKLKMYCIVLLISMLHKLVVNCVANSNRVAKSRSSGMERVKNASWNKLRMEYVVTHADYQGSSTT